METWCSTPESFHADCELGNEPRSAKAFSPDGRAFTARHGDTLRFWDTKTGQTIGPPCDGYTGRLRCLTFSQNGRYIVSGGDQTLRVLDTQKRDLFWTFPILSGVKNSDELTTYDVAFAPDGKRIVVCSGESHIRLLDAFSGHIVAPDIDMSCLHHPIKSVAFSPDGSTLLGRDESRYHLWDSNTRTGARKKILKFDARISVTCIAFSPDGQFMLLGGQGGIQLLDITAGMALGSSTKYINIDPVDAVAFSNNGRQIMAGDSEGRVSVWNIPTYTAYQKTLTSSRRITSIFIASKFILSASHDENVIRFWEADTLLRMESSFCGQGTESFTVVTMSPDEGRVAAVDTANAVSLWYAGTRQLVCPPMNSGINGFNTILALSFSPDNSRLTLACIDGTHIIWNAFDGSPVDSHRPTQGNSRSHSEAKYFDLKNGWAAEALSSIQGMRWSPFQNLERGLWAYIDGKVIHSNGPGALTIINTLASPREVSGF
ncbi:WD40 repeat-like protein [Athelia psychrophila]|uniref:WD40 repeat-like protein n=1 Tax=Athelia psychrophila TaxID=1759441 RepID=A0A166KCS1_9AGAM|nr:WD40 repeat-like protein [Fibularhizoctonia sp. CBS 109695]